MTESVASAVSVEDDTAVPIIPLILRGRVIEDELIDYQMRQGGDRFRSPNVSRFVDKLVTTAPSLNDYYSISLNEIIDFLAKVGAALDFKTNRHLQEAFAMSAKASALPDSILMASYASLPQAFQRDTIAAFVESQIGSAYLEGWVESDIGDGKTMAIRAFGARSVHIIAGNSPAVAFLTVLRAAVTRSDAIIKLPSNDPMTAVAILRTMIDIDPDHPVSRHMSAAYWKGGDDEIEARIYQPRNIEKIVAWGGFASVTHITKYLQPGIDLITLDPKHSGSIIGNEALQSGAAMAEVAQRLAVDIGAYNQELCASARVVYVVCDESDPAQMARLNALGEMVLKALQTLPEALSTRAKGTNPELEDEVAGIQLQDDFYRLFRLDDPGAGAVIVSQFGEPVEFADILANRTANLVPVKDANDALRRITAASQTIGVYPDALKTQIRDALAIQGAQHIVPLGQILGMGVQGPQDGLEPERRMLRWARETSGSAG